MTCWNNLDINEWKPKDNNDLMQHVTCDKSSLFAPRLKTLKKKRKGKHPYKETIVFECFWSEKP
jgi:hypothetical protein